MVGCIRGLQVQASELISPRRNSKNFNKQTGTYNSHTEKISKFQHTEMPPGSEFAGFGFLYNITTPPKKLSKFQQTNRHL